jgi:tRNA A-37 threonylcarbamoyl transferase component Bud32
LSVDDCLDHLEGRTDPHAFEATQRHLDECPTCCGMMAEATRGEGDGEARRTRALLTLAVGERVAGRYEIRRFIARGGMGEVYEAFDSVLQERVALKTLVLGALDQDDAAERLIQEVRIARRVIHPNVCRIMDVGFHRWPDAAERPVPFLTMDYLAGETLAHRIARAGRVAPSEARRFARDLCAGLGAVHRAGIIHRDFKSENVFLVRGDDRRERAVVMDFGLAWAHEREAGTRRSSGKSVLGTVDYMSPEQVEGRSLTPAADVYALGVVMFEMLVGRTPFSGESAAAVALSRLTRETPLVTDVFPELGRGWDAIVERCLARDPERRFASANEVAASLEGPGRRHRRRARPAVAAAIALGLAAGLTVASVAGRFMRSHKAPAVAPPAAFAAGVNSAAAPVTVSAPPRPEPAARPAPLPADSPPRLAAPRLRTRPASLTSPAAAPRAAVTADAVATRASGQTRAAAAAGAKLMLDRAEDLLAEGRIEEACATGEEAAAHAAAPPAVYRFLGRCYMRLGRAGKARANYRKYLETEGTAADASFVRAIVGSEEPP